MNVVQLNIDNQPYRFCAIEPEAVLKVWPQCVDHVEDALKYSFDDMTPTQVLGMILTDRLQLVLVTRGAEIIASMTVEFCEYASGKICHIMTVAGDDMEKWVDEFVEVWKAIASENGCAYISIKGREGWARYAKKHGFKHCYTYMRLEI